MKRPVALFLLGAIVNLSLTTPGYTQLSPYSQDFESLLQPDPDALGNDGWLVWGNVFDSAGELKFGYGAFPAPNGLSVFSDIVAGEGSPNQGVQQIVVYSDYQCCVFSGEGHFNGTDRVESNVFQEQTIGVDDVGSTWAFRFDAKAGTIDDNINNTAASAFIKTVDLNADFALTSWQTADTTPLQPEWTVANVLSITITEELVGQLLQFGFASTAENFEDSGMFYDNIAFYKLSPYSQDFETLVQASPSALGEDGWLVGASVFAPDGVSFIRDYFAFPAPNAQTFSAFSKIVTSEGGPDQGNQQLVVISDYNNTADHEAGNRIESYVYREQPIGAGDVGKNFRFSFDAKLGNINDPADPQCMPGPCTSTAAAFFKVVDSVGGTYSSLCGDSVDMTTTPLSWTNYALDVTIDEAWVGQLLQFGFLNVASNFEPSGIFYDNIGIERRLPPGIPYNQDFECIDQERLTGLSDDGWQVGANVFAPDGTTFLYNYFSFPAPNNPGSPAFSLIAAGEGGPDQGAQQLVVFSDYNNADHTNMSGNRIESNFFRELTIGTGEIGKTFRFGFDAKLGDLDGDSTAAAFVKVLDSLGGTFALIGGDSVDLTATPANWTGYMLQVTIDEAWVGQLMQFGFLNVASNSDLSGIFYDNIVIEVALDADGDGVPDNVDNCTNDANPLQIDSNGDGIGNVCDADIAGPGGAGADDCTVNFLDLGQMKSVFFTDDANADLVGPGDTEPDGVVNFVDLGRMKAVFFAPPGPSATGCN